MSVWLPCRSPTLVARFASPRYLVHARFVPVLDRRTTPHAPFTRYYSTPPSTDKSRSTSTSTNTPSEQATAEPKSPPSPKEIATPQGPLPTRIWNKVKHEAQHYWHGSKLLVSEVRISARLQWQLLHGDSLTRRERRQVNTVACSVTVWKLICCL